jgi:hypothetical protein
MHLKLQSVDPPTQNVIFNFEDLWHLIHQKLVCSVWNSGIHVLALLLLRNLPLIWTFFGGGNLWHFKVKAFRLSPGGQNASDKQGGYVDLDGEILARGQGSFGDASNDPMVYGPTIEVSVQQGLATLFCPS